MKAKNFIELLELCDPESEITSCLDMPGGGKVYFDVILVTEGVGHSPGPCITLGGRIEPRTGLEPESK